MRTNNQYRHAPPRPPQGRKDSSRFPATLVWQTRRASQQARSQIRRQHRNTAAPRHASVSISPTAGLYSTPPYRNRIRTSAPRLSRRPPSPPLLGECRNQHRLFGPTTRGLPTGPHHPHLARCSTTAPPRVVRQPARPTPSRGSATGASCPCSPAQAATSGEHVYRHRQTDRPHPTTDAAPCIAPLEPKTINRPPQGFLATHPCGLKPRGDASAFVDKAWSSAAEPPARPARNWTVREWAARNRRES